MAFLSVCVCVSACSWSPRADIKIVFIAATNTRAQTDSAAGENSPTVKPFPFPLTVNQLYDEYLENTAQLNYALL